jgi:hypothetical protein
LPWLALSRSSRWLSGENNHRSLNNGNGLS